MFLNQRRISIMLIIDSIEADMQRVNRPPALAGGLGLRLEAGLIGRAADCTTCRHSDPVVDA